MSPEASRASRARSTQARFTGMLPDSTRATSRYSSRRVLILSAARTPKVTSSWSWAPSGWSGESSSSMRRAPRTLVSGERRSWATMPRQSSCRFSKSASFATSSMMVMWQCSRRLPCMRRPRTRSSSPPSGAGFGPPFSGRVGRSPRKVATSSDRPGTRRGQFAGVPSPWMRMRLQKRSQILFGVLSGSARLSSARAAWLA
ncbi:MAG: hypothetical protein A2506_13720 [Elusimicrobia bacterium RIFOXYD12_FULL_66_9]|nr:MAG: hypothetical protein A2506_13720 [Elusimicrobia bacterium RIFOXYD12_FULL_66_9]